MPVRSALRRLLLVPVALALAFSVIAVVPAQGHAHRTRWDCLAHYESTHRWHIKTGNGHYGGLQFSRSTWRYYGGPRYSDNIWPHRATRKEQIRIAKRTAWRGWRDRPPQGARSAWPNTWPRCN